MARPLKLNACYFSHDAGMRNHRKVKALRNKFGHVGYSVWCMLLETLTDADLFQTDCTELEIELMSADFMVTSQELTDVIDYCVKLGLLARSEEGKISCPSLNERLTSVLRRKSTDLQKKNPELLQQKLKKKEEVAELLQQKPDKNGVSDEFPLINKKKKKEKETFSMCIVNNTSSNADASEEAEEAQPSVSTNVASIQDYYNSQVSLRGAQLRQSKGLTKKRRQAIGARLTTRVTPRVDLSQSTQPLALPERVEPAPREPQEVSPPAQETPSADKENSSAPEEPPKKVALAPQELSIFPGETEEDCTTTSEADVPF